MTCPGLQAKSQKQEHVSGLMYRELSSATQGPGPKSIQRPNREILETTLSFSSENPPVPTTRPKGAQAYSSSSSEDEVRDERSVFSLDLSSSSSSSSSEYTSLVFNGCFLARSSAKKKGKMFT